jgi:hypothetical protein
MEGTSFFFAVGLSKRQKKEVEGQRENDNLKKPEPSASKNYWHPF